MKNSELASTDSILKKVQEDLKKTSLQENKSDRRFQRLRQAIKDIRRKNSVR